MVLFKPIRKDEGADAETSKMSKYKTTSTQGSGGRRKRDSSKATESASKKEGSESQPLQLLRYRPVDPNGVKVEEPLKPEAVNVEANKLKDAEEDELKVLQVKREVKRYLFAYGFGLDLI